jgi:methanogenic corrinoid protein MtbC1
MGVRDNYHIIVGGGVVTPHWTEEIRADGYGRLSEHAVEVVNMLMAQNNNLHLPVIKE